MTEYDHKYDKTSNCSCSVVEMQSTNFSDNPRIYTWKRLGKTSRVKRVNFGLAFSNVIRVYKTVLMQLFN